MNLVGALSGAARALPAAWNDGAAPTTGLAAAGTAAAETSRDAQMAELPATASDLGALQSLASAAPAPITLPQPQLSPPPGTAASNELVDSTSAGDDAGAT